jgi:RNA polymerase II-associated factor 1
MCKLKAKSLLNFDRKMHPTVAIDISPEAQISNIETSFGKLNDNFNLSKLKHPTKPHLKPVDSWDVFPDGDIWANAYDLFKFSERPGDRPVEVSHTLAYAEPVVKLLQQDDPRLDYALFRPMESEGEHFLAYYLLKDEENIPNLQDHRSAAAAGDASDQSVRYPELDGRLSLIF